MDICQQRDGLYLHPMAIILVEKWSEEVAQLCPTLCDPMDCSLPGSSICGILQARILEWVAISFSNFSREGTLSHNAFT